MIKLKQPIAFIGRYFKTFHNAEEFYMKQTEEVKRRNRLIKFNDCYLVISDSQLRAIIKNNTISAETNYTDGEIAKLMSDSHLG